MIETLESREVFKGKVFTVTRDAVREGEVEYKREVVRHPGSGCVVAIDDDDNVLLVKQYRHAASQTLLEIVAGSRDSADEPPVECARRELEEELGMTAERLELLCEFYPSPGFLGEKMWLYLARDLRPSEQKLDDDEILEIITLPLDEALAMVYRNRIHDAKTIIALQFAAARIKQDADIHT